MRGFGLILLLGGAVSCVGVESKARHGSAYPDAARRAETTRETRRGAVRADLSTEGSFILVKASIPNECREVTTTPTLVEKTTERTLKGGATTQLLFGGAAATAIGVGIAGVVSKCPPVTGPAKDGTTYNDQCLKDDEDRQKTYNIGGAVMIGTGALLAGVVVVNAIRAKDTTEVVSGTPEKHPGPWSACGSSPADYQLVDVRIAGESRAAGKLGPDGTAKIDLSQIAASRKLVDDANAIVLVGGAEVGKVDLRSTPVFASWSSALATDDADAQARLEAARESRRAATKEALRQTGLERLRRLQAMDAQLKPLGPPWTGNNLKQFRSIATEYVSIAKALRSEPESIDAMVGDEAKALLEAFARVKRRLDGLGSAQITAIEEQERLQFEEDMRGLNRRNCYDKCSKIENPGYRQLCEATCG